MNNDDRRIKAPAPETSDEELIARLQAGEERAFDLIVGKFKDPLMNFAYRFLGDEDDADDVVQETFIRLSRSYTSYKPVAKFSTWLYTICANLAKTRLRKRTRHAMFSLDRRPRGEDAPAREISDTRYPADELAERGITAKLIEKALQKLPSKYREAVILSDIQELSYEEICGITGANIGTVKSRLNRGRAQLRKLLKDVAGEL